MGDAGLPLDRWANFYLLTAAAAATLVGLLFVVITLAAESLDARDKKKIRLYLTPTVVHFGSVLFLAALLTLPTQSPLSATVCCSGLGTLGIVYSPSTLLASHRGNRFHERQDVIQYVVLPVAAFGLFIAGGLMLSSAPQRGLTLVAAGMIGLVVLGLRNSWAIAVWIVAAREEEKGADK